MTWDRLCGAVMCGVLDSLSASEQAMSADICPVLPEVVLVRRPYTTLSADVFEGGDDSYRGFIEEADSFEAGDLLVIGKNPSMYTCAWGELLTTLARAKGLLEE